MKIQYVISCDDYVQYRLYLQHKFWERFRRLWIYWPMIGLGWLACIVAFFGCCFGLWKGLLFYAVPLFPDKNSIFAILAGGTTALALVVTVIQRPWERKSKYDYAPTFRRSVLADLRKGKNYVGYSCELTLGADEIVLIVHRERTERGTSHSHQHEVRVAWFQVKSIDEFDLHAFVLTKGSEGLFIPKSAFPDVLVFRAFVEEARRLWLAGPSTAITASVPPGATRTGIQTRPNP